jgi:hypothetical protein
MSKRKTIKVLMDTKLSDLKVGDLVITAELHRVEAIGDPERGYYDRGGKTNISVSQVKPQCGACKKQRCEHTRVMTVGWGQHCIAKVLE